MSNSAAAMRWCPACGLSYVVGIQRCSDCLGPLVDEPPKGHAVRVEVRYELVDWSPEQRQQLDALMQSAGVFGFWDTSELVIDESAEERVDGLIDFLEAGPGRTLWDPARFLTGQPAGPISRAVGAVIDLLVLVVLPLPILPLASNNQAVASIALVCAYFAYYFVPVALWGRTLGKIAARTKVVARDTSEPPGWLRAFIRAGVVAVILALPVFGDVGNIISIGLLIGVYAPILWRRDRCGVHDLLAGTQVVQAG